MSEVRRWAHTVVWEGQQISATYMAINDGGEYVMHDDYAALEAECDRLRAQVSALQSDANSWQSGYDKGREDGAKAAEGWKAQHARDSAELRQQLADSDSDAALRESRANDTAAMGHLADMRQQRDRLAELLRMVRQDAWYHSLEEHEIAQIDAALAEVKP